MRRSKIEWVVMEKDSLLSYFGADGRPIPKDKAWTAPTFQTRSAAEFVCTLCHKRGFSGATVYDCER